MKTPRSLANSTPIVAAQDDPYFSLAASYNPDVVWPHDNAANIGTADARELVRPLAGQPKTAVVESEVFHQVAAAPRSAGTVARPVGKHPLLAAPYGKRIASDNRAYMVGTVATLLGLLVMLGTIGLYLYRPAPSHVTLDNWCDRFSQALSCPGAENDAGKQN